MVDFWKVDHDGGKAKLDAGSLAPLDDMLAAVSQAQDQFATYCTLLLTKWATAGY